jgi:hypothetical protein
MVAEILHEIKKTGLTISILDGSSLVVEPKDRITNELRMVVRENKTELIRLLSATPAPCQNCPRMEHLVIGGKLVAGCLYQTEGGFSDGWKRLHEGLQRCLWPVKPSTKEKNLRKDTRTWTAGNPFTCRCGFQTGFKTDGKTLYPVCSADKQKENDNEF